MIVRAAAPEGESTTLVRTKVSWIVDFQAPTVDCTSWPRGNVRRPGLRHWQ
jgi:hypothetical protein